MILKIIYLVFTLFAVSNAVSSVDLLNESVKEINGIGSRYLRDGEYEKALDEILSDTSQIDSGVRFFKLGVAHAGMDNDGKALFYFRFTIKTCPLLTPFAYEKIGDIEYKLGRIDNSIAAYRSAAEEAVVLRYKYYMYDKMRAAALDNIDSIGVIKWLEEFVGPVKEMREKDTVSLFFSKLVSGKKWKLIDSIITGKIDSTSLNGGEFCFFCPLLEAEDFPDTLLKTADLYKLSEYASKYGKHDLASDWLHRAIDRKDFEDAVSKKDYLLYRANLNYNLKNYNNAVKWYKQYIEKYGCSSTIVYRMARSYRYSGRPSEASKWYDKHIEMYPSSSRSHDILWYRAWQKEDKGDYVSARKLFKKMYTTYPRGSKADDACFRYCLLYMKENNYSSALDGFSYFIKNYPSSRLCPGAGYWKAKALVSLNRKDEAEKMFINIARNNPFDYYGFKSREMLGIISDSSEYAAIDLAFDSSIGSRAEVSLWLDSITGQKEIDIDRQDSLLLVQANALVSAGEVSNASMIYEVLENRYPDNLSFKLLIATIYEQAGRFARFYRIIRRFNWQIPEEHRSFIPLGMLELLYPRAYNDLITAYSDSFPVSPFLVSAVMRQESIFDHEIVSSAGAVGLMQIMPFTGKDIAEYFNEPFSPDSLRNPEKNIKYGTYYLKKLLDQFEGNIVLAVAGYNGGPHNAIKWFKQNKDEGFDMFIEDIGFSETRLYVKRVLGNYWTYKFLEEAGN